MRNCAALLIVEVPVTFSLAVLTLSSFRYLATLVVRSELTVLDAVYVGIHLTLVSFLVVTYDLSVSAPFVDLLGDI